MSDIPLKEILIRSINISGVLRNLRGDKVRGVRLRGMEKNKTGTESYTKV